MISVTFDKDAWAEQLASPTSVLRIFTFTIVALSFAVVLFGAYTLFIIIKVSRANGIPFFSKFIILTSEILSNIIRGCGAVDIAGILGYYNTYDSLLLVTLPMSVGCFATYMLLLQWMVYLHSYIFSISITIKSVMYSLSCRITINQ